MLNVDSGDADENGRVLTMYDQNNYWHIHGGNQDEGTGGAGES